MRGNLNRIKALLATVDITPIILLAKVINTNLLSSLHAEIYATHICLSSAISIVQINFYYCTNLVTLSTIPPPLNNTCTCFAAIRADVRHCDVELRLVLWNFCGGARIYREINELFANHGIGSCIDNRDIRCAGVLCLNIDLDRNNLTGREVLNVGSVVIELHSFAKANVARAGIKVLLRSTNLHELLDIPVIV